LSGQGTSYRYYENGRLMYERTYQDGERSVDIEYNKKGEKVGEKHYVVSKKERSDRWDNK